MNNNNNDRNMILQQKWEDSYQRNDIQLEEYADEPASSNDEESASSNIQIENDRRERNRKLILIPIIITGIMMIIVGIVGHL